MKILLITAILVGLCAVLSYSQPRLEIPVNNFNFGYVPQNSTVVRKFWFKSTGTDTLQIKDIKTGCACAVMPLEKNWIAPGDSMRVSIFWAIKRNMGAIARSPRIFTNASPDPLRLHLQGTALLFPDSARPVSVKPYKFELAKSSHTEIDSLSFTLVNRSDHDLSVSLVSSPPDECELFVPDSVGALSSSTGYIKVKPEFADSEFKTSITLLLSDRKSTRLTIPIRRKFYLEKAK